MQTYRSSGMLRMQRASMSVQQCCPHTWFTKRPTSPAPVASPSSSLPPAAPPQQQQPAMVAVQAAAEPEVAVVAAVPSPPAAKPGRSFFDVMKFNGPGPELINGRLAMIGILAAAKAEVQTGATVLQQAQQAPLWLYAVLLLWVYASMVPMLKGARHEAFGVFTPRAEITNGRAAMLGFAILLALEYKAGVPFF